MAIFKVRCKVSESGTRFATAGVVLPLAIEIAFRSVIGSLLSAMRGDGESESRVRSGTWGKNDDRAAIKAILGTVDGITPLANKS